MWKKYSCKRLHMYNGMVKIQIRRWNGVQVKDIEKQKIGSEMFSSMIIKIIMYFLYRIVTEFNLINLKIRNHRFDSDHNR